MAKTLTISVQDAIEMLEARLAEGEAYKTEMAVINAEIDKAYAAWEEEVSKAAAKLIKGKTPKVGRSYGGTTEVAFYLEAEEAKTLPEPPRRREPVNRQLHPWEVAQIQTNIKVLTKHTEPTVSMGTLNKIMALL